MKNLLLFLSTLLLAFCSISPANAQSTQTYFNPTCGDIEGCQSGYEFIKIGPSNISSYTESQEQNRRNHFCKAITKYNNSEALGYQLSSGVADIVGLVNYTQYNQKFTLITVSHSSYLKFYSEVTCSIAPPPPPPSIPGCTNPQALNYNPQATEDDGSCQEKVEGCTDPTDTNYNANAHVHVESMCQYSSSPSFPSSPSSPPSTPPSSPPSANPSPPTQPAPPTKITGFFDNTIVPVGATTWTMKLRLNVENPVLQIQDLYIWDKFTISSMNIDGKDLTFNIEQTDGKRLEVEKCTNYEITIPKNTINADVYDTNTNTMHTIKNFNEIRGNFTVEGCEHTIVGSTNTGNGIQQVEILKQTYTPTMHTGAYYVRLMDIDENGNQHVNIGNLVFLLGLSSFFLITFFVLFGFIKNSFLGKSKKSFR